MSLVAVNQESQAQWYALYTKARHEKFVESQLLQKGVEAFTPKVTLRKKWSDRIKLIQEPLFKSYCFAKFSLFEKIKTTSQPGVVEIVHFKDQFIPVPEPVIESLRILTQRKVAFDPIPYIKVKDTVRIAKGPLKGVEGFVLEKRNRNTALVVSVAAIGCAVQCIVDIDCVEPA